MENAVTLYAHDAEDKPVCVLLKKKVSIVYYQLKTDKIKDKSYSVSCKCEDRQLAQSIVEDIIEVIRNI
jgi:hypothetical protein